MNTASNFGDLEKALELEERINCFKEKYQ